MNIYIDIDETICKTPENRDYNQSVPILENIERANKLFDKGHTITYWTARGTLSGIDWEEITKNQLKKWKVKYHFLIFGKPSYDLLIDDKTENWSKGV